MLLRTVIIAATALALVGAAAAQDVERLVLDEMALDANPRLAGVEAAFVTGAFDAEGLYAANSMMREGTVFPPHSHPDDRMTVVVSGTMHLGVGETVDPDAEQAFEAGSVALTPAGTVHYMVARDGDLRVLEIGVGPSGTAFADAEATD